MKRKPPPVPPPPPYHVVAVGDRRTLRDANADTIVEVDLAGLPRVRSVQLQAWLHASCLMPDMIGVLLDVAALLSKCFEDEGELRRTIDATDTDVPADEIVNLITDLSERTLACLEPWNCAWKDPRA